MTEEEIEILKEVVNVVKILKWIMACGGISIAGIAAFLFTSLVKLDILHKAVKSQMRKSLMDQYNQLMAEDHIDEAYFNEFENQYKAYHKLTGENQVLDDRHKRLIERFNTQKGETHEQ